MAKKKYSPEFEKRLKKAASKGRKIIANREKNGLEPKKQAKGKKTK